MIIDKSKNNLCFVKYYIIDCVFYITDIFYHLILKYISISLYKFCDHDIEGSTHSAMFK